MYLERQIERKRERDHSGDHVQLEKASCHSSVLSSATDKVDHRETAALRPCPSNTRTSSQESVGSAWEGGRGVREEDGEAGRQIWTGSGGRCL